MGESLTIKLNFWIIVFGFGALQGYFFAGILFFQQRGNLRANRWLSLIVLLVAYFLTVEVFRLSGLYHRFPHTIGTGMPFWYLLGPLLYFYVKLLLDNQYRFSPWHILHLLPFAQHVYRVWPFYMRAGEEKIRLLQRTFDAPAGFDIIYIILAGLLLSYLGVCIRLLRLEQPVLEGYPGENRRASIAWLKRLLIAFAIYIVFDTIAGHLLIFFRQSLEMMTLTTMLVMSAFVQMVAFTAVRHPEKLFPPQQAWPPGSPPPLTENSSPDAAVPRQKYQNSALTDEDAEYYLANLLNIMDKERPYLNSELKLADLAGMLGISTHHLSQLLNQKLGANFYDFVNEYRIREIQQRLLDPAYQAYTILGIAFDTGFSSKTSFNRLFKKLTGFTPSEYVKAHHPSS